MCKTCDERWESYWGAETFADAFWGNFKTRKEQEAENLSDIRGWVWGRTCGALAKNAWNDLRYPDQGWYYKDNGEKVEWDWDNNRDREWLFGEEYYSFKQLVKLTGCKEEALVALEDYLQNRISENCRVINGEEKLTQLPFKDPNSWSGVDSFFAFVGILIVLYLMYQYHVLCQQNDTSSDLKPHKRSPLSVQKFI